MIEVIDDIDAMRSLESEWQQLSSTWPTPLLQFDWFISCAETLHNDADLRIVVVRDNKKIVAIAPLVEIYRPPCRWLEFMGMGTLYEPCNLIYTDTESLKELLKGLLSTGLPINLQRLPVSSPIKSIVNTFKLRNAFVIQRDSVGCYYVPTDGHWDEFYASIKKNQKGWLRSSRKRADKAGKVEIEITCPEIKQVNEYLDEVIRIEAASWKGHTGTSLRDNLALQEFFCRYMERASRNNTLRIAFLRIDGQALAMHLGVECFYRLWIFKSGYDESWKKVSPGMQLVHETIKYSFSQNSHSYEFLGSKESWEKAWPVSSHDYCSVVIYPISINGLLGFCETAITYIRNRFKINKS